MGRRRRARTSPAGRARWLAGRGALFAFCLAFLLLWPVAWGGLPGRLGLAGLVGVAAGAPLWWRALRVERAEIAADRGLDVLRALAPDVFEEWVAARLAERGYRVR